MTSSTRKRWIIAAISGAALVSVALLIHPVGVAFSGQLPMAAHPMHGHDHSPGTMPQMHQHGMEMQGSADRRTPTLPGQDAFGAIQEIVALLEADPQTDWSKVDLEALRNHLIDMNEVTLHAEAASKTVEGGLEIAVTDDGSTRDAIRRMLPAHAAELNLMSDWTARTAPLPDGVLLTVTSPDPGEARHIRGLGFIGLLVSGAHHQPHHLAMATGTFAH